VHSGVDDGELGRLGQALEVEVEELLDSRSRSASSSFSMPAQLLNCLEPFLMAVSTRAMAASSSAVALAM